MPAPFDQLVAGCVFTACAIGSPCAGAFVDATVRYTLTYERDASPPSWRIVIDANDIDPTARDIALRLNDFGSWTELSDYYLTSFTSSPTASADPADPARMIVTPPAGWGGSLHAEYTLHPVRQGSPVQQSHALLPVCTGTYTYGCTQNSLMAVEVNGRPLTGARNVTLIAPDGWSIFSGWAGESASPHTFAMRENDRNGLFAMGQFSGSTATRDGLLVETRQFGSGAPMTEQTLTWISALAPQMARSVGTSADPVRVFLTDSGGGMMTDSGLMVGVGRDWTDAEINSPYTRQLIAHELYHTWLGGEVRPDLSLVWFLEGFTDYLSLWHAAKAGIVPREWFVQRLLDIAAEAARDSSFGKMTFADPAAQWRDNNGPIETMAYKGGHVLAFALDVELRRRGHETGLSALMRDLVAREERICTLADVRGWLDTHASADLYARFIAGTEVPDVEAMLLSIGCERGIHRVDLAYVGIRAEQADPAKEYLHSIVELDPDGPAAKAGAKVGDVITGWFPARRDGVAVGAEVKTPYTFCLTRMTPGIEGAFFGALRGDEEVRFDIAPLAIPGGEVRTLKPGPTFDEFFAKPE